MRRSTVNCVLLACIAATLASDDLTRSKRDLLYLKNLITSTLFGTRQDEIAANPAQPALVRDDGSVKIFRIPGFNNILVKAVPKVNNIEAIVPIEKEEVNPKLSVIQSYLGTNTPHETLIALQGVKNLLESGVLNAKHDAVEIIPVKPPVFVYPPRVPEFIDVLESKPVVFQPPKLPLFPILPPIPRPVPISQPHLIKPIKVPQLMPVPLPSKYSYKQMKEDGSVTTYSAVNSQDVIVRETNAPMLPPPSYILDRFRQICLGVPWSTTAVPVPVSKMPCTLVRKPTANVGIPIPLHTNLGASNFNPRYYKPLLNDVKVTSYSGTEAMNHQTSTVQTATKEPTSMPGLPFYSYKYDSTKKIATNPYSLPNSPYVGYSFSTVNNKGYAQSADREHLFYNHPESHLLFPKPFTSKYIYKQIDHSRPEYFAVTEDKPRFYSKGQDKVKANIGDSNGNEDRHSGSTFSAGTYSYKKKYHDGSSSTHLGSVGANNDDRPAKYTIETNNVMHLIPPAHIVNGIENIAAYGQANQLTKAPTGYSYKIVNNYVNRGQINEPLATNKGETSPGIVMFEKPVPSSYIYKQINHNSPHPFTVVKVEDKPTLETKDELGEVFVSVNKDEYGKSEASQDNVRTTPHIPKPLEYVYVPPLLADEIPLPDQVKLEIGNTNKDTSVGSKEQSTASAPNSLTNNPIVVAPLLEHIYSYKQSNSDGSSTYVSSGKTDTEKVNETNSVLESFRGDIPEAIS